MRQTEGGRFAWPSATTRVPAGPLLALFLLYSLHIGIRIFYLAIIPGLLAFVMVLFVREQPAPGTAKSKIDISVGQFECLLEICSSRLLTRQLQQRLPHPADPGGRLRCRIQC
jgi:hypothetical protein